MSYGSIFITQTSQLNILLKDVLSLGLLLCELKATQDNKAGKQ